MSVVTINRVQDVCVNPTFDEVDLETLDAYLWDDMSFDEDAYRAHKDEFNSVHIGNVYLRKERMETDS